MGSPQFKDYHLYSEDLTASNDKRKAYRDAILAYADSLYDVSAKNRTAFMPPQALAADPERFRGAYIAMLGAPLTNYAFSLPEGTEEYLAEDDLGSIFRVTLHVDGVIPFYGLLFFPKGMKDGEKRPLVICQHGGGGTPELCSDMHGENNYNHMTRRMQETGVVCFAPQLYLWNSEKYGIPSDRGPLDLALRRYGGSLFALEIYCIRKAIDYFSDKPYIDPEKIAMHGLSYGGMYTLYTMAADTRIKAGYDCGSFNDRTKPTNLADLNFHNGGNTFMEAEIAALCAPRPLYIDVGKTDPVFGWETAEKEFARLKPYYEAYGKAENVVLNVWEGGHTVCDRDDGQRFVLDALGWKKP